MWHVASIKQIVLFPTKTLTNLMNMKRIWARNMIGLAIEIACLRRNLTEID